MEQFNQSEPNVTSYYKQHDDISLDRLNMSPVQEKVMVLNDAIATLDVTSEEINVSDKFWKDAHQRLAFPDDVGDDAHVQRKQSQTWTYGVTENIEVDGAVETSVSYLKHNDLNGANSETCNGVPTTDFKDEFDNNGIMDKSSQTGMNVLQATNCVELTGKSTQKESLNPPMQSTPECFSLGMDTNNSAGSEFMDISLQVCDEVVNDAEERVGDNLTNQTLHSSRPSLGSLFGWISAKSSPSQSNSGSVGVSPEHVDPVRDTTMSSEYGKKHDGVDGDVQDGVHLEKEANFPSKNESKNGKGRRWFWKTRTIEPLSTTALILENRPRNLPQKPLEEAQKHQQEYEKMVEFVKKHEIKDMQKKKKQLKEQYKLEDSIASTSAIWSTEILPNWAAMHQTNRTRQLWWQGLPSTVRGRVWQLAIGNELNITRDLYEIMVTRAHDKLRTMHETQSVGEATDTESLAVDRESTVELIRLDISRTFPVLCIFQKGGPYHDTLHDILGAYVCYRPDIGYVQGMSFMAAMLLLNMEPSDAFATFANLINKPCQLAFFRLNEGMMKVYFAAFEVFFEENLPKLFAHFKQYNLTPDMYLIDWIFTMFSKALCFDTACRVWDLFCRDGEEFLFKTAIAILKLHEDVLLSMEFIHAAQFLTRLPTSGFTHHELFRHISDVVMVSRGSRRWKDVLSLLRRDEAT